MKNILVLLSVATFFSTWSQSTLNDYKYVVVPLQYEFLTGKDTYRLNTLTRVLFKEEGFEAYFTEETLPEDLFKDRCLAVYADVKKLRGGPFRKKVQIIIKNCTGDILFESEAGDSKENNHQKAYNEAVRNAFKSVKNLKYQYKPKVKEQSISETKIVEKKKKNMPQIESEKVTDAIEVKEDSSDILKNEKKLKRIERDALHKDQVKTIAVTESKLPIAYKAKKVDKGYDVYSNLDVYRFTMYPTILNNVYIFRKESKSGHIVKQQNGDWIIESIQDGYYAIEKILLTF